MKLSRVSALSLTGLISVAIGQAPQSITPADCPKCAEWTLSQQPFRVYGNTYWVGTRTLGSILITSPKGHILIDGTVQEGAPQVAAHIRALGFRVEDVRLILNTHVHYDHAGGIAALQKLSGAQVAASPWSARILMQGHDQPDDPLFDDHLRQPTPVKHVLIIKDGETLSVGTLSVTAHFTPGHTPGGTTWAWKSCEDSRCLNIVYADSLSAVSADSFHFSHSTAYPNVLTDFAKSLAVMGALPCDILLTNHPEFSDVMGRLEQRNAGHPDAFIRPSACRELARVDSAGLERRLTQEAGPKHR
jgi:metallo-beta-lactamase class B